MIPVAVVVSMAAATTVYVVGQAQATPSFAGTKAHVWLTTANQKNKLTPQKDKTFGSGSSGDPVITVDPNTTYQSIVGFGGSLTDASAYNISRSPSRDEIMGKLFGSDGIGLSFLRQPIGTSDFSNAFYSLDDLDIGTTDPELNNFSTGQDEIYIIPMIKKAMELNPQLTVMASPWSAPPWMKTTLKDGSVSMVGGSLKAGNEKIYAQYLKKFVQDYQAQGIPITYLTVENEPQATGKKYPYMPMGASQESTVINYLGPDLRSAGLNTKILAWDHNWDVASYPEQVLKSTGSNTAGRAVRRSSAGSEKRSSRLSVTWTAPSGTPIRAISLL